jgi:flagellar biosynthesis protein FlhF
VKVKSYYAASVEAAMAAASREMGQDAVLITSRRAGSESQHLGAYEVVFGSTAEPSTTTATKVPEQANAPAVTAQSSELALLRDEITQMHRAVRAACRNASSQQWIPELGEADAILTEADIPAELREDILEAVDFKVREEMVYEQARPGAVAGRRLRSKAAEAAVGTVSDRALAIVREQFNSLLEVSPGIQPRQGDRCIVALAGPSGSGKTTTLLKLAIQHGLAARRSVHIVSTDFYRAGATEQIRVCSAAIGVGFQVVDSPWALGQALDEHRNKKLILIDTAGAAPSDLDAQASIASYLAQHAEVETHLVLPATYSSQGLAVAIKRFACFAPVKSILTKLDEVNTHGAALGHVILAGLPVSFVTNGQHVPDDLLPASKPALLSFLDRTRLPRVSASAA